MQGYFYNSHFDGHASRMPYTYYIQLPFSGESCEGTSGTIQNLRDDVGDRFDFDCYDIYGQASDSSQSEKIASCVASVIYAVQQGTHLLYTLSFGSPL